jgi:hypothetical protein
LYRLVPLEQYHATALVAGCEVVARLVELDSGDNVRWSTVSYRYVGVPAQWRDCGTAMPRTFCYVFDIALVAETPAHISRYTEGQRKLSWSSETGGNSTWHWGHGYRGRTA